MKHGLIDGCLPSGKRICLAPQAPDDIWYRINHYCCFVKDKWKPVETIPWPRPECVVPIYRDRLILNFWGSGRFLDFYYNDNQVSKVLSTTIILDLVNDSYAYYLLTSIDLLWK